ncbi:MAG: cytochrome c [Planctomycetales bacterium]|nr:cytochrome c [Planctomycetales bacterium]MCA9166424.1 cytochrome c [Planctomycetales bacterium]
MKKAICVALALAAILGASVATAQIKKGKTRILTTKQLMGGLVQPHCKALGDGLKEAPADDDAWAALATHAALLNETSYLLMDDGRCPDATWADASKILGEGSAELYAKIEAKDAEGAQAAFKAMTQSCGTCHKAHKK